MELVLRNCLSCPLPFFSSSSYSSSSSWIVLALVSGLDLVPTTGDATDASLSAREIAQKPHNPHCQARNPHQNQNAILFPPSSESDWCLLLTTTVRVVSSSFSRLLLLTVLVNLRNTWEYCFKKTEGKWIPDYCPNSSSWLHRGKSLFYCFRFLPLIPDGDLICWNFDI